MEIFKDICNYENYYQASSKGNIISLGYNNTRKRKILKGGFDKNGYKLHIFCVDSVRKTIKAHRIIAQTFIPNPLNKPQVNHINGVKHDNRVENLEWCTNHENIKHAQKMGLMKGLSGEKNPMFGKKLTIKEKEIIGDKIRGVKQKRKIPQTSKYVGVYFHKASNKWMARINYKGNNVYLGIYAKEEEARDVYLAKFHSY